MPSIPNVSGNRRAFVRVAARFWNISPYTLWGVYGTESGFGANLGPSSAGAVGPFQFLPDTARSYHINPNDFNQAAMGAAHYLHDLGADTNPESTKTAAALNRYSGGGGAAYSQKVISNGKTLDDANAAKQTADVVTAPLDAASQAGAGISAGIKWLTNPSSWLRVGKGMLGLTLISLGTGAVVLIATRPVAKAAIGVTGTGKAVQRAVNIVK